MDRRQTVESRREPLSCQANPKNTRPNRVKESKLVCGLWRNHPCHFSRIGTNVSTNSLAENQSPLLLRASVNTALLALRLLFLPLLSLLLFFFLLSTLGSRDQPGVDEQHLCKRDPNNGGDDQGRRNRRSQRVSLCRGRRRRGKVDFWWLVQKLKRIVSRCGGLTSGLAFSPFVFV